MTKLALEDHIVDILGFVADDLEFAQTPREQFNKSRGNGPQESPFSKARQSFMPLFALPMVLTSIRWFRNTGRFERVSSSNGWRIIRGSLVPILRI